MDDIIELCGLDDFEALRLSATGVDPDTCSRRPIQLRARLDRYATAELLHAVRTARHLEDAACWRAFMDLTICNFGVADIPSASHDSAAGG